MAAFTAHDDQIFSEEEELEQPPLGNIIKEAENDIVKQGDVEMEDAGEEAIPEQQPVENSNPPPAVAEPNSARTLDDDTFN